MLYKMEVIPSGLNVRSGPSISYKKTRSAITKGTIVNATEMSNGWYKHDKGGWSSGQYLKLIEDLSEKNKIEAKETVTPPIQQSIPVIKQAESQANISSEISSIKELNSLYGIPHQFLSNTDNRLSNSFYGRKFGETIMSDLPVLTIKPGIPKFLSNISKEDRKTAMKGLADNNPGIVDQLTGNKDVRYYTFQESYSEYIKFVNSLCRQSATYLGIGSINRFGKSYGTMDWDYKYVNRESIGFIDGLFGSNDSVTFYMDASNSFDESASNSTGQSMLESGMKSASEMAREAEFLLGAGAGVNLEQASIDSYNENIASISNVKDPNSILSRLGSSWKTISSGGNLLFPELWKESNYSKSYSITMKLMSPYGDKESVYLNILVPFFHLLSLTLPRISNSPNGYVSPFLIRAFSKGMFNVEMGIIDNISFKKGGSGDDWTVDGLPTALDVTISIKDLYPTMSIAKQQINSLFYGNIALLDFLATTSSLNLNKPALERQLESFIYMNVSKFTDVPNNIYRGLHDSVSGLMNYFNLRGRY